MFFGCSKLKDNLKGFYRSSYRDPQTNTTKTIATTQFESTHARRAFPCFDEPSLKAKFTISLGRFKNMTTLSNTVIKNTTKVDDDFVMDHYEPSVTMSTYLLAFIVSEFRSTHVRGHQAGQKEYTVHCTVYRDDHINQTKQSQTPLPLGGKIRQWE